MRSSLDKQLAAFLRQKRGDTTYAAFARKLGIAQSTLHRLESGEQSATLQRLHQILQRLKCQMSDVFGENF